MKVKPFFCITLLMTLLLYSLSVKAWEDVYDEAVLINYPGSWAESAAIIAQKLGIEKGINEAGSNYKRAVTRSELAALSANIHYYLTGSVQGSEAHIITDREKAEIDSLYIDSFNGNAFNDKIYLSIKNDLIKASSEIILDGKKFYTFSADSYVTREQYAVTLYRVLNKITNDFTAFFLNNNNDTLSKFIDKDSISDDAKEAVAFISGLGVISGNDMNEILPQGICKYDEALQMTILFIQELEAFGYSGGALLSQLICSLDAPTVEYTIDYKDYGFGSMGVELVWGSVPGALCYAVDVLEDSDSATYKRYITSENSYTLPIDTEVVNKVIIRAGMAPNDISVNSTELEIKRYTPNLDTETAENSYSSFMGFLAQNKNAKIDYVSYSSNEQAMRDMQEVTFKVWDIKDGEKITVNKTILVHKSVAADIIKIFDEIYKGEEKFPIHSITGYNWRGAGSKSSHMQGLAIDINPNENYYISTSGKVYSGSFYNPEKSSYSIPKDGDVVRVFTKYGWFWGGIGWDSSKDYMHFSYTGV